MGATGSTPRSVTFQSDENSGRVQVSNSVARRLLKLEDEPKKGPSARQATAESAPLEGSQRKKNCEPCGLQLTPAWQKPGGWGIFQSRENCNVKIPCEDQRMTGPGSFDYPPQPSEDNTARGIFEMPCGPDDSMAQIQTPCPKGGWLQRIKEFIKEIPYSGPAHFKCNYRKPCQDPTCPYRAGDCKCTCGGDMARPCDVCSRVVPPCDNKCGHVPCYLSGDDKSVKKSGCGCQSKGLEKKEATDQPVSLTFTNDPDCARLLDELIERAPCTDERSLVVAGGQSGVLQQQSGSGSGGASLFLHPDMDMQACDQVADTRPARSAVVAGMTSATLVFSSMVKQSDKEFSEVAPTALMSAVGAGLASAGITYVSADAMIKKVEENRKKRSVTSCADGGMVTTPGMALDSLMDPAADQLVTNSTTRPAVCAECSVQEPAFGEDSQTLVFPVNKPGPSKCGAGDRDMQAVADQLYDSNSVTVGKREEEIVTCKRKICQADWQKAMALPETMFEDAKKAIFAAEEHESDMQRLHNFYQSRLENLNSLNKFIVDETTELFKQTVEEVERKLSNSYLKPVCADREHLVIDCYKKHGKESLKCSHLVNDFMKCVDHERSRQVPKKCGCSS